MERLDRPSQLARRTEGKRVHGRSARVCEAVLEAAAVELGRVGFSALRIEDVAARSGVNKTTVYRRWPTKLELVAAVIERESVPDQDFDHGSMEADVRATLHDLRSRLYTARHRGVIQVLLGERAQPEVAQLVRGLRQRHSAMRQKLFERAMARGEIAIECDCAQLVEFMTSPLVTRIIHMGFEVDDAYIEVLTRFVCAGAAALGSAHAAAG
ncbi:MAG: TetR family transcriptional regulator [Pseudomonadota bacterium]|jgi:AcrR family transcriptional regulator